MFIFRLSTTPIIQSLMHFPTFFPTKLFRFSCNKLHYKCTKMGFASSDHFKAANFRLSKVSGRMTELLEIQAPIPTLHVLFIPGNPGIIHFYKDFVESLYEELEGSVSITAIGHISQTAKDYENGQLFSLEEQIDHKMDFLASELQNNSTPVILVGHSIGSYISIEVFKRASQKVNYCIALYPFMAQNTKSSKQNTIRKLAESPVMSMLFSSFVALLGLIPSWSSYIVKKTIGSLWSETAVDAGCSHLLKYHTIRNVLYMAMTEFRKFSETAPDWKFLHAKQDQIAVLFGEDDHWGPLTLFDEISKQAPEMSLSIEKEEHGHAFSVTMAGSRWVAQHVAKLIQKCSSTQ